MKLTDATATAVIGEPIKQSIMVQKLEIDLSEETKNFLLELFQVKSKIKCIAQIEVDTEEVVKRIKEEYDITDGWIPCSERLPEEFYVLCCDNHGEMLIVHPFKCDESDTGFSAESEECYMRNCIAWMSLPKPYREDSE